MGQKYAIEITVNDDADFGYYFVLANNYSEGTCFYDGIEDTTHDLNMEISGFDFSTSYETVFDGYRKNVGSTQLYWGNRVGTSFIATVNFIKRVSIDVCGTNKMRLSLYEFGTATSPKGNKIFEQSNIVVVNCSETVLELSKYVPLIIGKKYYFEYNFVDASGNDMTTANVPAYVNTDMASTSTYTYSEFSSTYCYQTATNAYTKIDVPLRMTIKGIRTGAPFLGYFTGLNTFGFTPKPEDLIGLTTDMNSQFANHIFPNGASWVRHDIFLENTITSLFQPGAQKWDYLVKKIEANGEGGLVAILQPVDFGSNWASWNDKNFYKYANDFATAAQRFAARYKGKHIIYEILNEPYYNQSKIGGISTERMADLVYIVNKKIKEADPNALTAFHYSSMLDVGGSDQILAYGTSNHVDFHSYHGYFKQLPEEDYDDFLFTRKVKMAKYSKSNTSPFLFCSEKGFGETADRPKELSLLTILNIAPTYDGNREEAYSAKTFSQTFVVDNTNNGSGVPSVFRFKFGLFNSAYTYTLSLTKINSPSASVFNININGTDFVNGDYGDKKVVIHPDVYLNSGLNMQGCILASGLYKLTIGALNNGVPVQFNMTLNKGGTATLFDGYTGYTGGEVSVTAGGSSGNYSGTLSSNTIFYDMPVLIEKYMFNNWESFTYDVYRAGINAEAIFGKAVGQVMKFNTSYPRQIWVNVGSNSNVSMAIYKYNNTTNPKGAQLAGGIQCFENNQYGFAKFSITDIIGLDPKALYYLEFTINSTYTNTIGLYRSKYDEFMENYIDGDDKKPREAFYNSFIYDGTNYSIALKDLNMKIITASANDAVYNVPSISCDNTDKLCNAEKETAIYMARQALNSMRENTKGTIAYKHYESDNTWSMNDFYGLIKFPVNQVDPASSHKPIWKGLQNIHDFFAKAYREPDFEIQVDVDEGGKPNIFSYVARVEEVTGDLLLAVWLKTPASYINYKCKVTLLTSTYYNTASGTPYPLTTTLKKGILNPQVTVTSSQAQYAQYTQLWNFNYSGGIGIGAEPVFIRIHKQ